MHAKGNSKKAMFMILFAQECYAKFNLVCTHHFENTPWTLETDYKSNVVRVWQKINEYQGEATNTRRAMKFISRLTTILAHFALIGTCIYLVFMLNSYFWVDYLYGESVYISLGALVGCYIAYMVFLKLRTITLG